MRVLVCGGRDYNDAFQLNQEMDSLHREINIAELIHGAARGADSLAAAWAHSRGVADRPFPADWKAHGKSAGFIRNEVMLREGKPDLVVAFPGGKGTADMIR